MSSFAASTHPIVFLSCQLTLQASYDTIFVAVEMGVYLRGNNSLVEEMRKADFIGGLLLGLVYTVEGKMNYPGVDGV